MASYAEAVGIWRKVGLALLLLALIAIEALLATPYLPAARDFDQTFYPAIRYTLAGQNPYTAEYTEIDQGAPPNFFSPPWLLLILLPFGFFSPEVARALWLIFLVSVTVASVVLLHPPKGVKGLWPLALVALPWSLVGILYGQVTGLVLLGAVMCMSALGKQNSAPQSVPKLLVGLLLVGLKPQLGTFVALPLIFWMAFRRDNRLFPVVLIGFPIVVLTLLIMPLQAAADVYEIAALWQSTLERELFLWAQPLWIAHMVRIFVLGTMLLWAWRLRNLDRTWWAAWLAAVLIITPYSRAYDGVLLIPLFGQLGARRLWWQAAAFLFVILAYTQLPNGQPGSVIAPLAAWLPFVPWRSIFRN